MSNREPSAIVPQGIPCMRGIIPVSIQMEKTFAQGSPRFTFSKSRMRSPRIRETGERPVCPRVPRDDLNPEEKRVIAVAARKALSMSIWELVLW
jgi:hypothetical protein